MFISKRLSRRPSVKGLRWPKESWEWQRAKEAIGVKLCYFRERGFIK